MVTFNMEILLKTILKEKYWSEAVVRRFFSKKVSWKISPISQEDTFAGVIKLFGKNKFEFKNQGREIHSFDRYTLFI